VTAADEGEPTGFPSFAFREPVMKHAALIPVSDDMLIEWGKAGPRFRSIPDRERWYRLDREAVAEKRALRAKAVPGFQHALGMAYEWEMFDLAFGTAPAWEFWDKPQFPDITIAPRLEALAHRLATGRTRFRHARAEVRRRLAGCWLALKGALPEYDPYDP